MRYIKSSKNTIETKKWQFIWKNVRYVVSNIPELQKQSLGLGQITMKVRREGLGTKRQFQNKA